MSLRSRLLIAIGIIFVVALAAADVVTYSSLESFLYNRVDQQLNQTQMFEGGLHAIRSPQCLKPGTFTPSFAGPGHGGHPDGGLSNVSQEQAVEVRSAAGVIVTSESCPAYVDGKGYTPLLAAAIPGLPTTAGPSHVIFFDAPSSQSGGPDFRVSAAILPDGNVFVAALPLGDIGSTLHHLLLIELAVSAGAVVIALAGGWWLVRIGLRPLRDMEATAESIAAGNLTERVPGANDKTEVGRLAATLNVMLGRIESAFGARVASEDRLRASEQRLRRFVADASHELRTPIAAVSAYAELFGRGASEQKADLERLMVGIRTETTRMEHLVADLLLLARLDEGRPMEQRSVDVVALCAEAVHTAATVGPQWPVSFEASQPIEITGDATSLRQVIDNLLANVRAHTPPGTHTRVALTTDGADNGSDGAEPADGRSGGAVLTVSDNGPGMDPDQAEHVFERFYRSDPSRSRTHGGAGLGLSIVSAIVAAHGGTVAAESQIGSGTTFTVRLPQSPPVDDSDGAGGEPDDRTNDRANGAGRVAPS